jgi:hypothetical protein
MNFLNRFLKIATAIFATAYFICACDLDDQPPTNIITRYNLPHEVADEIFTADVLQVTGSLEPFLDRIQQHGMRIYEGNNPPPINLFRNDISDGDNFYVKNDCIYDEKHSSYADSLFGKYDLNILIPETQGEVARASVSYRSMSEIPAYRDGLDSGDGTGIAAGNDTSFTIFYKVLNGRYDKISYQAVWIISGTFHRNPNLMPILTDVTQCMVLVKKGTDAQNQMANLGTIRIFRDPAPEWHQ